MIRQRENFHLQVYRIDSCRSRTSKAAAENESRLFLPFVQVYFVCERLEG